MHPYIFTEGKGRVYCRVTEHLVVNIGLSSAVGEDKSCPATLKHQWVYLIDGWVVASSGGCPVTGIWHAYYRHSQF